jgi:hypothetical protein
MVNYSNMHLTKAQARRFLLAYQGLWPPGDFQGKPGVLAYIRHVGCIQFDPLNIVGHNTDLVLQARVAGYRPDMLQKLLYEDRKLLDGFDKLMAVYPVEDWPYFQRRRDAIKDGAGRSAEDIRAVLPQIRVAIEERGPLSSIDLEMSEIVDWDWAQSRLARAALESMYFWGELVIHHKVHTRKFYDFTHRCLPAKLLEAPDPNETVEAYQDWYVHRRIGSVGLLWNRSGEAWWISSIQSKERTAALPRLLEDGRIVRVQIEGIKDPFYICSQDEPSVSSSLKAGEPPLRAIVMAPLDNMLWDRRMLKEIFDFDYRWEVYVPADKRRYGYYVLPVLYGDRFIARFEPGHEKKLGVFTIKNWWWEAEVIPDETMQFELVECFRRFLAYLGANSLEIAHQAEERGGLKWLATALS